MGIIIRQSIKGTLVTYIGAFIGFLTTLYIIPKFIGEELFGLTRVILDAAIMFAAIFQLGSSHSAIRFFPHFKSSDGKNNGFFFYLISVITIGFLLFLPVFFLLKEPVSAYFSKESPLFVDYLYWVIPLMFFCLYWLTFEVYANVLMRIAVPKFIREILLRLLVIVVYLAYAFGFINLDGLVTGFVCCYGIAMLVTFFYVSHIGSVSLKHNSSFITKPLRKDFFSYTAIFTIGALGSSLVGKIDSFMISGMEGLAWTGIYTMAFYMISVVEIPSRSITSISSPVASEAIRNGDMDQANQLYKKVSLHQLLIGSALFFCIWINIDNIYLIIPNGERFGMGKWVVFFIGLARLIEITINFGSVLMGYSRYFRWNLFFSFFVSGITILFNLWLIPLYGISGAGAATTLAFVISFALQQGLIYYKLKVHPYSKGTLKILGIIALALSLNYLLPSLDNPYFDTVYRTLICGLFFAGLTYWLQVSSETNLLVKQLIAHIKTRIKR